ncbi:MAG: hypothetical protein IKP86_09505, partial [Anaerolineaceae bacterium]|nr:hypothetical protein [Anaerolineaceae bacterium]
MKRPVLLLIVILLGVFSVNAFALAGEDKVSSFLVSTSAPADTVAVSPGDLVKTLAAGNDGSSQPGSGVRLQNIGDTFSFGRYEQDSRSGADLIEWQVLAIEDGRALVISRYALEPMRYNRQYENTTWETSSLRKWLNGEFYNSAFSADEKSCISETAVSNPDNQKYGTGGGNDTQDKIFLLSIDEANQYFADNEARTCEATYYTEKNGANVNSKTNRTMWWLRSPGEDGNNAAVVYVDGSIYDFGLNVDDISCTVRPSFWLILGDDGELPVSGEMPETDPVYTPTRTPEPDGRPGPSSDDEDLAAKFDCMLQMGIYDEEMGTWTEYKGSTYNIDDLSEDEGFSFALFVENKTNKTLTPTISAYVNGEEVIWDDVQIS